jgi:excinuclease ABC subunit A
MERKIIIRGAEENNLRSVDLEIPHRSLTVVTGVSGSGKSSLAFDTVCREGQRRYLESFSTYTRQLLGKMGRPAVAHISGLAPALAIDQKTVVRNPRSTVGTLTELYDYLRLLFAKVGSAECVECGKQLTATTAEGICEALKIRWQGQEITLCGQIIDGHRGEYRRELMRLRSEEFSEVLINGRLRRLDPLPELKPDRRQTIDVVVGRCHVVLAKRKDLEALVERALQIGSGVLKVLIDDQIVRYSTALACEACGAEVPEIGPRLFSFNSPYGACSECKGLGLQDQIAPDLLIADPARTLREGALVPTTKSGYIVYSQVTMDVLNEVCEVHGFNVDIPWRELTMEQQNVVLFGSYRIKIPFGKHPLESRMKWSGITAKPREEGYYKGILPIIEEILKRDRNKNILRFVRSMPCPSCNGSRLSEAARSVKLEEKNISAVSALPLCELREFLGSLTFSEQKAPIGAPLVSEMIRRIDLLERLGLGYLQLERESTTLSGGEAQRIRLATQVGTGLHGVLYVLDEPSIGLHHSDNRKLLETLSELRDNGNTIVVVEHDEETAACADWLVQVGPGAGEHGGEITYCGPADKAPKDDIAIEVPEKRRDPDLGNLVVQGAAMHNLRDIDATFKLGAFNVVTGLSGAGKTTLVERILAAELRRKLHRAQVTPGPFDRILGDEALDKVIDINQAPIGRTPRSNPATYTALFDHIRTLFASLPDAEAKGYGKGHFSMNVKGGRCEDCQGAGVQAVGMHFLGDVTVTCESCGGKRFSDEMLTVTYRDKTILDVLEMPVATAAEFFADQPAISRILTAMEQVGLGYLTLGQPATTLSGGEAQRVKLASELGRPSTGRTLYILAEPTTGLHHRDIRMLLKALNQLVDNGNTVIVIEHHLDVILSADWVLDLGPGSGVDGGTIVCCGTPETVSKNAASLTGQGLAEKLAGIEYGRPQRQPVPYPTDIVLRGVTTHNLKALDITIPGNQMTVITGVSGSGKSSLAFDTIYAEGQRMFSESLSTYTRRFLGKVSRAQLEEISGLTPAVAIGQRPPSRNPRSTVGTMTEIYDYYRLLYARAGISEIAGAGQLTARHFSFNHHLGACDHCKGLGLVTVCDPEKLVTEPDLSLFDGAISGTKTGKFYGDPKGQHLAILETVGDELDIDFTETWRELDKKARQIAMYGTGDRVYTAIWQYQRDAREGEYSWETTWDGFVNYVAEEYQRKHADHRGEAMLPVMKDGACPICNGDRLAPEVLAVRFAGRSIADLARLSVTDLKALNSDFLENPQQYKLTATQTAIAAEVAGEIGYRLQALSDAGLDYLTLDRGAATLSGGEAQRIRLATQLGTRLTGVTYVLDEPTVGLHARDTERLIAMLRRLCDSGNTVIVVEHDADMIRAADYLIDLGPGAGNKGGEVMATGTVAAICESDDSPTGRFLSGKAATGKRGDSPPLEFDELDENIEILGATIHNLTGFDMTIPAGGMVAVTGVSGSGKSSLVFSLLLASAQTGREVGCKEIEGLDQFADIIQMDQQPIGTSATSNPATYTGIFDPIRELFAKTRLARQRKYKKTRFSFNTKGGRCEECQGAGRLKVSLDFLADVTVPCESCNGRRYNKETLECTYRGLSIAEVLGLTITEAMEVFAREPKIAEPLEMLEEIGLGYLQLGQASSTLSGGESQRLKLATELIQGRKSRYSSDQNLYLFDEPTTGLHFADIERLLAVFDRLTKAGHTLIVVEHNPQVIGRADWVIDLGPEGGSRGGKVVAAGTPEEVASCKESFTGQVLARCLADGFF